MDRYPLLEFNLKKLYHNTEIVTKLCENYGIKVAGIIKGFGGIPEGAEEMAKGGCYQIGSSRIDQLRVLKERGFDVPDYFIINLLIYGFWAFIINTNQFIT
jgi:predicted amino acid racemase